MNKEKNIKNAVKLKDLMGEQEINTYNYSHTLSELEKSKRQQLEEIGIDSYGHSDPKTKSYFKYLVQSDNIIDLLSEKDKRNKLNGNKNNKKTKK